ncbi:MAG: metallophosphoesterase [Patescibacteria group bacterium]|nr:metallophosphoesterase [Patescibacteria group bacterium]
MPAKKIAIGVVLIIIFAIPAGLVYFFVIPQKTTTIAGQPVQSATPELKSFRGVLADILKDAEEKAEEIGEAVTNPFANDKSKTAEPVPQTSSGGNNFTFAIIGDTQYFTAGNARGNFQKAVANISKFNPDLVVQTGDLIRGCEGKNEDARDYANWKNTLGALVSKTYAVQGNHDRVDNEDKCDQIWQNTFNFPSNGPSGFSELTYSLDVKNSHFVFLDSNKPDAHEINSTQRDWLEQDLAANKKENTFIVFHEPAYPVSDKATESLDVHPSERNGLWRILEKYNVTAVFNGHEHIVSHRKIGTVHQFVFGSTDSFNHGLPSAGVAEYSNQGQGRFGIARVNGKEITVETHGPDGSLLNTFTFSK